MLIGTLMRRNTGERLGEGESRTKLFLSNMLVYGFGSVLAKLVPFVMLPIVTRLMPGTVYFGLSDLTHTLVQFAQAFAIMGMYDAMFRMFFERDEADYKRRVCSTAFLFVTGCSMVVAVSMLLLHDPISRVFFGGVEFSSLVVVAAVSVIVGGNGSIIQAPTRMLNKKLTFIILNLVTAVLSYAVAIPMILVGEYVLALPVAAAAASLVALVVFAILNRQWFSLRLFDVGLLREMLAIGVPLMPTFLFYWVFNSVDRLMIVNMIGTDSSGVYAAAAKIGAISQLIYTAFAQGWQYFAFSTMHDEDQVELNSRVYEYLGVVSFVACGLLSVLAQPLFWVMFPERYSYGAVSSVYLFLAPLLLMLYQVVSNQLLVIKKTWPTLIVLTIAAVTNVLLNYVLIPVLGIEGASIATLFGYVIANIGALCLLTKMNLMAVKARFGIMAIAMVVYLAWWRLFGYESGPLVSLLGAITFIAGACWLYRGELSVIQRKIKGALHGGKR